MDEDDRKRDEHGDLASGSSGSRPSEDCGIVSRFETTIRTDVLRVRRPGTRWLSSTRDGGFRIADAAYALSVPRGFSRTDLDAYVADRRREVGFPDPGPALLTGLALRHARGARSDPVDVVATAGLSNPAALPIPPNTGTEGSTSRSVAAVRDDRDGDGNEDVENAGDVGGEQGTDGTTGTDDSPRPGTVNLVVVTDRALDDGGLTTLLATAVEAKAATLVAETGFSGTTSDAIVVGCDPKGPCVDFAGSATPVGSAVRACVRDAVRASLRSRYPDGTFPATVADAEYGVRTTRSADPFDPADPSDSPDPFDS